ncbi:MAG TPA: polysaccharide biosynthesis/export family protein [Parachlamydiaceae bacterium]|nr:polysaccharide biosynthesis/export family protein [Parachlamydiaceae bacterium]
MKPIHLLLILSILILNSCTRVPCHDHAVMGCDEFVMDSYKIRQGKFAILEMQGIEVEELPEWSMDEYRDVIAEDDILNITVYHPNRKDLMESIRFINEAMEGFRVTNGMLSLPDISPVAIIGLTLEEARFKLTNAYQEEIQNIEVFISYRDRLDKKVELTGQVKTATVPIDGKIRLYEVIAKAHLPKDANFFMSYVMREGSPLSVDLHKLINQGDMSQNIVMHGGDKIFIASAEDSAVMMMGEVRSPRPVTLPYGFMSLREALVQAGGIPFTGDLRYIQVIRGDLKCPKIYVLSWEHIIHLPNNSLLLIPGDTVYVSEKPITKWNRFIEQLLPSFNSMLVGYEAYKIVKRN